MKIIALRGPSSKGKTTTLNLVYDNLIAQKATSTNKQLLGGDPNDFSDIVLFNGKKIAFFTMGDFSIYLVQAFTNFSTQGADILICALNVRFVRPLNAISSYPGSVIQNKTVSSASISDHIANNNDSLTILSLI